MINLEIPAKWNAKYSVINNLLTVIRMFPPQGIEDVFS